MSTIRDHVSPRRPVVGLHNTVPGVRKRLPRLALYLAVLSSVLAAVTGPATHTGAAQPTTTVLPRHLAAVDDAASIFGLSGTFAATCTRNLCGGSIGIQRAAAIGGSYMRFSVNLSCFDAAPPQPSRGNVGTLADLLRAAAGNGLIPILDIVPRDDCPTGASLAPSDWRTQMRNTVAMMYRRGWYPRGRWIYFEIGNEPNLTPERYWPSYPTIFRAAAQGVQAAMRDNSNSAYRVLTAGMLAPTAQVACTTGLPYAQRRPNYTNLKLSVDAVGAAERSPDGVPPAYLGVSVHPYKFNTDEIAHYWRNYYYWGTSYSGTCYDLGNLIGTWMSAFPNLPIFFTETDWSDHPQRPRRCLDVVACEGTYLVDLFTWLRDHGYSDPRTSYLRVMFFRGADADLSLGLYGPRGNDKAFWTGNCPLAPTAHGWTSLVTAYSTLVASACY